MGMLSYTQQHSGQRRGNGPDISPKENKTGEQAEPCTVEIPCIFIKPRKNSITGDRLQMFVISGLGSYSLGFCFPLKPEFQNSHYHHRTFVEWLTQLHEQVFFLDLIYSGHFAQYLHLMVLNQVMRSLWFEMAPLGQPVCTFLFPISVV